MDFITAILVLILMVIPIIYLLAPTTNEKRQIFYMDKLPGPPSYPIVGTAKDIIGLGREEIFEFSRKQQKKYGPVFRTCLGKKIQVLHIQKPEHFELVMSNSNQITKGFAYNSVKPWLGDGLLISSGAKWHMHRKLLTPAFHFKILENFAEVFNEKAKILIELLKPKSNGEVFDMFPSITHCALDIICETAMGVEINAMAHGNTEYVTAIYDASQLATERIYKPWLRKDFIYYLTQDGKKFKNAVEILHGFTNKVLADRKNAPRKSTAISTDDELIGKKHRLAFLDLLLEASQDGKVLSDIDIRAEIDTFMFAGHDTTSAAMCWTLFCLGNSQEWQDRVYEEIESVFGGKDRNLTIKDLGELKILERVIKEALRLYPSAPIITRKLSEDVIIDGYLVPNGANCALHIFDLHRDPEIYPNPAEFNPDRFLPEISKSRHAYSFVPFSAGPRNCIGQKFAMYEEKTLVANILRNFRVKAIEKHESIKLLMELILRPRNGLQVILEPRIKT